MENKIKLVALDIDGVISKSKGSFCSGRIIKILAEMNDKAAAGSGSSNLDRGRSSIVPPVTVITGRPGTYVEALLQAIHGFTPAIFEHGTGLYNPKEYLFKPHPDLTSLDKLESLKNIINRTIVRKGQAIMQGGKDYSLSLFSKDKRITPRLKDLILEAGGDLCGSFDIIYSSDSINIIPKGFHKGKGIDFLSRECGVLLENILGVGDSDVDIPFMAKTGFSAAPSNAGDEVKKTAAYVSDKSLAEGLEDILDHFHLIS
ncbi:MAG: HAD hydrolase family protein [Spirochaetia bacterium]|jgi:hydroxymethylpyrimidine pyrophosphatase-like HAD family hydrolase|nr:HAD hydrolase family protein [Spirochaetia bacterium]